MIDRSKIRLEYKFTDQIFWIYVETSVLNVLF